MSSPPLASTKAAIHLCWETVQHDIRIEYSRQDALAGKYRQDCRSLTPEERLACVQKLRVAFWADAAVTGLNAEGVEYLVVGGWALGVHGYVRATGDMDIWIGQDPDNIDRLIKALEAFGVPKGIDRCFFKEKGNAFRMGNPPMRIEIITEATGIEFEASFANRFTIEVDGLKLPFLSYADLVRNKRASGRRRDLADLEGLGENPD